MNLFPTQRARLTAMGVSLVSAVAAVLSGCGTSPKAPHTQTAPDASSMAAPGTAQVSQALTPRAYRRDAAQHLYAKNADRIYHGKLPPLLYAIGVLQVEVDNQGRVTGTSWMRAPTHAPEVMAEIERTVRAAAPYPVPMRMSRVTYTDTWLWHQSGTFQLDTLTEGQL
jgi:protein TonB